MAKNLFCPRPDPNVLKKFGPRFEIEVWPPIIRDAKGVKSSSNPNPNAVRNSRMPALIDTGASRTVLTPAAVQKVNLPFVGYTCLSRAGGMDDRVGEYVASIQFPRYKLATIEVIPVLCCDLPGQHIECLIGRDILARWLFVYDGRTGEWKVKEEDVAPWVEPPEGLLT